MQSSFTSNAQAAQTCIITTSPSLATANFVTSIHIMLSQAKLAAVASLNKKQVVPLVPDRECLFADGAVHDVLPQGHAYGASAPELMSASRKVKMGLYDDKFKINGCAADMWSAGTVLYEMLTGHRAFNPEFPLENVTPARDQLQWPDTVFEQTELLVILALCFLCSRRFKFDAFWSMPAFASRFCCISGFFASLGHLTSLPQSNCPALHATHSASCFA